MFIATAAHCVTDVGAEVSLVETGEVFGEVAVIGDLAESATDWALIRVHDDLVDRVDPSMRGYPLYPTGVTTPGHTRAGDPIQQTDLGTPRQSTLVDDDRAVYVIAGPVVPFDSGGPLAHVASREASGLVSRGHNCTLPSLHCETYSGPTVQGVIAKAGAAGFDIVLRTV